MMQSIPRRLNELLAKPYVRYTGAFVLGFILVAAGPLLIGSDTVVRITDDGFVPNRLQVDIGTRVTFINETARDSWPAADPHPEHTSYGAQGSCDEVHFDPCIPLPPQGQWSITFDQKSAVAFHDHLMPGRGGVIRIGDAGFYERIYTYVRGLLADAPPTEEVERFRRMSEVDRKTTFSEMAEQAPGRAWEFLKVAATKDGQVLFNVHDLAHIVGNELYREKGMAGIRVCDDSFAYGCRHGVSEAFLVVEGPENIVKIARACNEEYRSTDDDSIDTGCIHGIGHGLAAWERYDLSRALTWCDELSVRERNYCYDGVLMETFQDRAPEDIDIEHPWDECSALPDRYQQQCARYTAVLFGRVYPQDIKAVANVCDRAPTQVMKETCAVNIGFRMAQASTGRYEPIKEACDKLEISYAHLWCIMGAAREGIFQKYGGAEETAKLLCESLTEPEEALRCAEFIDSPNQ